MKCVDCNSTAIYVHKGESLCYVHFKLRERVSELMCKFNSGEISIEEMEELCKLTGVTKEELMQVV